MTEEKTGQTVVVIGAGLAGSEAAWQLARRGFQVRLYEMRPVVPTPAHLTGHCAELVCSNSFGSLAPGKAAGMLKSEMEQLGSFILEVARENAVPAGHALAVDREAFGEMVTQKLESHPLIELVREELSEIPEDLPCVVASGPLTSQNLAGSIQSLTGEDYLYFYDAIAPLLDAESIDMSIAFRASRYENGTEEEGDYINCPFNEEEYERFVDALKAAERIELRDFEKEDEKFFEGCLPIEIIASRGRESLAFGPMRPVGLTDPRTGRRPYAAVQLRQDNLAGSLYNLVGFQTNIKWGQQEEVLRLIPGLQNAEFTRLGQMHRNTFINSPSLLEPSMQFRKRPDLFFGGQIVGVEGYMGNAATGLMAGMNLARHLQGKSLVELPRETMLGTLCYYVTHAEAKHFQPMKANFGIIPPLEPHERNKKLRYTKYGERGQQCMKSFFQSHPDESLETLGK